MRLCLLILLTANVCFANVSPEILSVEVGQKVKKVPEFAFIQQEAERLGIKVYLFGGTASAFAHYVRWDLEREAGDTKYQKERFDYDFTNIYRGNQDLDIVVDGTAEQAEVLKESLMQKYPHFVGSKDAWEVRLLKEQIGDKLPLLGDEDFRNQHTDTNSTGMIAINPGKKGLVFRDLFAWEDSKSQFLRDVSRGEIKFLFSEKHEGTRRYRKGLNPPILAAVRYLAKLTQYRVKGTKKDLKIIKEIIEDTNFRDLSSYGKHKVGEFGKKALLNSPDIEYAWNLLEEVGLRKKLIEMDGNQAQQEESLSWWMSKEPLRSRPLFKEGGKTAKEIFNELNIAELIVSHETNSFMAYESITRSSQGKANVFISRAGVAGEAAVMGSGFYTKAGLKGARGTGITVRFKLNPNAIHGEDFTYSGEYFLILNSSAVTLIQESLEISVIDFMGMLKSGELKADDKGHLEKLTRKFKRKDISEEEFKKIVTLIEESGPERNTLFQFWFLLSRSSEYEPFLEKGFKLGSIEVLRAIAKYTFAKPYKKKYKKYIDELLRIGNVSIDNEIIENVFTQPGWEIYFDDVLELVNSPDWNFSYQAIKHLVTTKHWNSKSKVLIKAALEKNEWTIEKELAETVLGHPNMGWEPEVYQHIIDKDNYDGIAGLIKYVFSQDRFKGKSLEFIRKLLNKGNHHEDIIRSVLSKKLWGDETYELTVKMLEQEVVYGSNVILDVFLVGDYSTQAEQILLAMISKGRGGEKVIPLLLDKDRPYSIEVIRAFLEKAEYLEITKFFRGITGQENWFNRMNEVFDLIFKLDRDDIYNGASSNLFDSVVWMDEFRDELVRIIDVTEGGIDYNLVSGIFFLDSHTLYYPEIMMKVVERADEKTLNGMNSYLFAKYKMWNGHNVLKSYLGTNSDDFTAEDLQEKSQKVNFLEWQKKNKSKVEYRPRCSRVLSELYTK